jgi:hypothetical protein
VEAILSEVFRIIATLRTWPRLGLFDEGSGFLLASNSTVRVPEHLRNESGTMHSQLARRNAVLPDYLERICCDVQSTDKKRRKGDMNDIHEEGSARTSKISPVRDSARFDDLATKLTNVDESDVLLKKHRKIVDDKKQDTTDTSMDADTQSSPSWKP